jgi:hypothetical protein
VGKTVGGVGGNGEGVDDMWKGVDEMWKGVEGGGWCKRDSRWWGMVWERERRDIWG